MGEGLNTIKECAKGNICNVLEVKNVKKTRKKNAGAFLNREKRSPSTKICESHK